MCAGSKLTTADKKNFLDSLPAGIRLLDLSMSGLGSGDGLPTGAFSRFQNLIVLNLEYNRITRLPRDVFKGLQSGRINY